MSVGPSDLGETGHSPPELVGDVVGAVLRVLTGVNVVLLERCLAVHEKVGELISLADTQNAKIELAKKITKFLNF